MKKSLLALLFAVALAVPALAENMWVGGDLSYNSTSQKGSNEAQMQICSQLNLNLVIA